MAKTKAKIEQTEPKVETYQTSLKVELTPEQVADRADRAAQMIAERDAKEEEHKAAAKHSKSVIEALDAEIRRLSNEVRTRSTYASVECERRFNYATGLLTESRTDTGETVNERRMTDSEKQLEFAFNGEADDNQ